MATANHTRFKIVKCILLGVQGMEDAHAWLSIPFCSMFILALLGNGLLLFIVIKERSLHQPMFFFLAMLASSDLVLSTTTMPKTLSIFWFSDKEIAFEACVTQMFIIHFLFVAESAILLAMAYDRYVAICNPLQYSTLLTHSWIVKIGVAAAVRAFFLMAPVTFLLLRLPFCGPNVISHTFCEHIGIVRLACADITLNIWFGLTLILLTTGVDTIFIAISYVLILRTVFRLPSNDARAKALGTCGSHLCVILMFYVPAFFSIFVYRFAVNSIPRPVHILLANLFAIVPPMLNPIVYGVKNRQLRDRVALVFLPARK
ncbi:olfactory receptor 52Z1P-like [Heteronotia binoei]|uniref:olfactory receptor 52Z1P-like n=1 Tax=Heteronotia binoei TaxID=13085 RepID=UPI00292DBE75|nr:olfactory receptor 52Z1P-like [Heteronotia binoei]